MRKYLILAIIVGITSCSIEQKEEIIKEYNLKGAVKNVVLNHYETVEKFGEFEKGKKVDYDITETVINLKSMLIDEYHFNENGKRTKGFIYYEDNRLNQRFESQITEKDEVVGETWFNGKGDVLRYVTYTYTEDKITTDWLDENKKLKDRIVIKLDSLGNKSEESHYNSEGKLSLYYKYKCDLYGNVISQDFGMSKDLLFSAHYDFEYNDNNDMTGINFKTFAGDMNYYKFEYKYDSLYNWTQKISIKNSEPYLLTERIIEYY